MRRKRVVSGPIHGPVREELEDKGPGGATPRTDNGKGGKVRPTYTANGGFMPAGFEHAGPRPRRR